MNNMLCAPNRYGYKLNINHAKVKPLYERYKAKNNIRFNHPLSDAQRLEFETILLKHWGMV